MTVRILIAGVAFGATLPALAMAQTTTTMAQTTTTTTTTSTTLPGACVVEASFASLTCRTDALALRLRDATDLGRTKGTLMQQAAKLNRLLGDAQAQLAGGDKRKASTRLKKAGRALIAMGFRVRSLTGRRQIAAATRFDLQNTIAALSTDVNTLRKTM